MSGFYPAPPPLRPTNGWAVAALASAFVFPPAAIVCGHIALVQMKRTGEAGKGLAVAGLILGYALTVLAVMVTVVLIWIFQLMLEEVMRDVHGHGYSTYALAMASNQADPAVWGPLPLTRV